MGALKLPSRDRVEIWIANSRSGDPKTFENVMSASERERAAKFRFDRHREMYIFSCGALRGVLARYLDCPPQEIEFEVNQFGKPFLKNAPTPRGLVFNLSHSGELVVVAVTAGRTVGVDVEAVRPLPDMTSIARTHFTRNEQVLVETASASEQDRMFFTCWTRKEAYIKAIGRGLSIPLTSFDTAMSRETSARLLSTEHDPVIRRWWLSDLVMPNDYVGAVVVEGDATTVDYRQ